MQKIMEKNGRKQVMRLFDRPQENERKGDAYEEKLRDLKAQKIRITRQIGEKFIEESAGKDMAATPYADLFAQLSGTEDEIDLTLKRQLASRGLRKCESCGAELPINSAFCNKCGAKQGELETEVVTAGRICPKCGATLEEGDVFCISCGYKL
ncbi:zinc ribbon domain-containing protein [Butyrivibrio proteoclasticus]|nr:zinc ribbon domain-containing protein [Butyrivibrio proteoclasticus]